MQLRSLSCPNCGAPLPRHARWTAVTCAHCGASVTPGQTAVSRESFRLAVAREESEVPAEKGDLVVAGRRWRVLSLLARGELSDVFLATGARRLTERVLIKVLRVAQDADLFAREWDVLTALHQGNAQGAAHFSRCIPALVSRGEARAGDGTAKPALIVRAIPGFDSTLDDARRAFAGGAHVRHAFWMWRRLLEVLGWVHRNGWVHGAVLPQHVVLHARDHGAMLVGWSSAVRAGERIPAACADREAFYPASVLGGGPASPATDLSMAARSIAHALCASESWILPTSVPPPVREILEACAAGSPPTVDAWRLNDLVDKAGQGAFGPPVFLPFHVPS